MQLPGRAKVEHFIRTKWTNADHQTLDAEAGNPKHQAEWEAYMLLGAVRTWHKMLAAHTGNWRIIGDAKGVLQGVIARKAKSPRINLIVAEIQLALSDTHHEVTAEHIWSEKNKVCDVLSRSSEGVGLPAEVRGAQLWPPASHSFELLGAEACRGAAE